ncbi:PAS domain S-box protein [bacterium]|nr:PAS domain S-box protein [bacterium]
MINIKNLSIRKKLIAIQLLTAFIVLILFGAFLVYNDMRVFRNSVISQLSSTAQLIGANSTSALNFLDNKAAEDILFSLETEEDIVNAWIYDAEGNLFAKYNKIGYDDFSFPKVEKESSEFESGYVTLSQKILQDSDIIGIVSLRLNMEQRRRILGQNIIIAFFVLIIGMIAAFFLSLLTQRTISNPILKLAGTTKEVSETGDYSIRVEKKSNDEVGILYDGFNNMLEQIDVREIERNKAEKALRISEENYRAIFDAANDAIFVHDLDTGAILDVNNKMCEMYGYTREEACRLDVEVLSQGEPPYTRQDALRWIKKAAEGKPQLFEWMAKDKTGRLFWVEVNMRRVVIGGQNRLLVVVRDISERKQAEAELRKHREHLEKLVKERTAELEEKNKKLERYNRLFEGREFRIKELRDKVKELKKKE